MIFVVRFEMILQPIDVVGQQRNLYFWRPCVSFFCLILLDDVCFACGIQCHFSYSKLMCATLIGITVHIYSDLVATGFFLSQPANCLSDLQ